jgi:uncharacterized CHY-type Zn-finger protein
MERIKLTPAMRLHVAYKCKWSCFRCQDMLKPSFHVDHHIPLSEGGSNQLENLVTLCGSCHAEKTQLENMMRSVERRNQSKYFTMFTPDVPIPPSCQAFFTRRKNILMAS